MSRPVLSDADRADGFRGVAHPTRRRVIRLLGQGEMSVSQLLAQLKLSPQALSGHLTILRETGIVTHRTAGPQRLYRLSKSSLRSLGRWLAESA